MCIMPAMATDSRLRALVAQYERGRRRRLIALKMHEAGRTMQSIGRRLGVSKQRVSQLVAQAKRERQDGTNDLLYRPDLR